MRRVVASRSLTVWYVFLYTRHMDSLADIRHRNSTAVGFVWTIRSLTALMRPLRASTWGTGVVVVGTPIPRVAGMNAATVTMIATVVIVIRTEAVGTTGTTGTVTTTAGTTGTGATVAARPLVLATHRSTGGAGATREALPGVAALRAHGTTMPRHRALCLPRTATATPAGEATVR